jgi:hypothetical protein
MRQAQAAVQLARPRGTGRMAGAEGRASASMRSTAATFRTQPRRPLAAQPTRDSSCDDEAPYIFASCSAASPAGAASISRAAPRRRAISTKVSDAPSISSDSAFRCRASSEGAVCSVARTARPRAVRALSAHGAQSASPDRKSWAVEAGKSKGAQGDKEVCEVDAGSRSGHLEDEQDQGHQSQAGAQKGESENQEEAGAQDDETNALKQWVSA